MMKNKQIHTIQKGFTLIELLVVIAIIGILASVLMVNFIGVRQRARDAQRKTHIKQIQSAFELYRSDNGRYPCYGGCTVTDTTIIDNLSATIASYLSDDVTDPLPNSSCANYLVSSTGSNYTIYAILENTNDADATANKTTPKSAAGASPTCNGSTPGKCTSYRASSGCNNVTFNYWVNNP